MSISALNWAFNMRGVSVSQKVVLISLANFADEAGYAFPSIKTIADMSCVSESSVRRALADLVDGGILRIDYRFRADGSQTSSGYFLGITTPVNLTPPPSTVTPPPVTADTPYNHHITTTLLDTHVSIANKRGSRLKDDWQPSETDLQHAFKKGLSDDATREQAERFRDYWISKAGAGGVKLDWAATWRTWIGNYCDRKGTGKGAANQPIPFPNKQGLGGRAGAALRSLQERERMDRGW